MANCNNRICMIFFLKHYVCYWLANYIASPKNNNMFAFCFYVVPFQQFLNAGRSAGSKCIFSNYKITNTNWMKSINIFFRRDCFNHFIFINVLWKRKLNEYTVDFSVLVISFNKIKQFLFRN